MKHRMIFVIAFLDRFTSIWEVLLNKFC